METNKGQFHCLLFSQALFGKICIISYFFVPRHNCKNYFRSLVVSGGSKKEKCRNLMKVKVGNVFKNVIISRIVEGVGWFSQIFTQHQKRLFNFFFFQIFAFFLKIKD